MTLLELSDIHVIYQQGKANRVHALRGVNLTVEKGDFISVAGPSGSGKSTLLYVLGGLLRPDRGTYRFSNQLLNGRLERALAAFRNRHIGFVLQDFGLLRDRSVLENVCTPALFSSMSFKKAERRAKELLDALGIGDLSKRRIDQISGGQSQRVAIARALLMDPSILLADEPTGALDHRTTLRTMKLFSELNAQGITILTVTHNPEVSAAAKTHYEMRDGLLIPASQ